MKNIDYNTDKQCCSSIKYNKIQQFHLNLRRVFMKNVNVLKRIVTSIIAIAMCMGITVSASAANVSFAFDLGNTGTAFNTYTGGSNKKVYSGDPASVRTYSNNAHGYGFAFIMQYINWYGGFSSATVSHPAYWISGAGITHPVYASGQNKTNRNYYVAARIDDDYTSGSCTGYFNSDYVN